ncbi:hypothetical protein KQI08_09865 [Paraeggerthella hongkongensis]|uniref:DapH/DapD/GlmU-related protein n=1 Tax=Paraeggerthella hominis TaxID=2897351 RepID=UPI001C0F602E|nr:MULTISPECIES: DapH/DapD/GlmU-related protein [Paraeggerthella]MBU5406211.1 hypothetical protein [Paraeggerthella hongkongensis]MCD2434060.1 hypothetical protein [Paraeggerthella hominis]
MYFYDNYYSLSEFVKLGYSFVMTRLWYRDATLIRRPFYVRGGVRMKYGKGFTTGYNCRIEVFGDKGDRSRKLFIGENVHIGDNVHIAAAERVSIGDNCLFASKIFISDLDHGIYTGSSPSLPTSDPNTRDLVTSPVSIGENVWLGENVCILKGVSIGDGCIVGANSVVTKSIPAHSIAVGSPARVIKRFDEVAGVWKATS